MRPEDTHQAASVLSGEDAEVEQELDDDDELDPEGDKDEDEEERDVDGQDSEDNDYGDKKYEAEEYQLCLMAPVKRIVTLKLFVTKEAEFQAWLQTLHVECIHNGKVVGTAAGRFINRNRIRPNFYEDMESPSQDMSDLAFEIFDRYGFLKKEIKEHPVRKGKGAWGDELDTGNLFQIEHISLNTQWRRQGLGSIMAKAIIRKAENRRGGVSFSLTIPGVLQDRDLRMELEHNSKSEAKTIRSQIFDNAIAFWRSLGFRRIGASICFGLAKDPAHKAHKISSAEDCNPVEIRQEVDEEGDNLLRFEQLQEGQLKNLKGKLPLHYILVTFSDTECVKAFEAHQMVMDKSNDEWTKTDPGLNNILHVAALFQKPKALQWLIKNIDNDNVLHLARNIKGYTPLENLQACLESFRVSEEYGTMRVCVSDNFRGYPQAAIACLGHLQGFPNLSEGRDMRLKYGCTCEECLEGFMSPRMKFVLLVQAELLHDMLYEDLDEDDWCDYFDNVTRYVSLALMKDFRKNSLLRASFVDMFNYIAACLRQDKIPREINVVEAWRTANDWPVGTRNFLNEGVTVESVLKVVFARAREQDDKAGDGETLETFGDDILRMPECRNDHEFGFVAWACYNKEMSSPN
jgi:hypothetical protein